MVREEHGEVVRLVGLSQFGDARVNMRGILQTVVGHRKADAFLHHMVRFLVGTMLETARGRRAPDSMRSLLESSDNSRVSPPAPPHALFLDRVQYPRELYVTPA